MIFENFISKYNCILMLLIQIVFFGKINPPSLWEGPLKKLGLPYPMYASTKELEKKRRRKKKKVNNKHESDVGGGEIFFWPVSLYSLEHLKNPWMKERKGKQRHALLIVSVICPYKWLFLDPFFFLLIFFCWCYSVRSIHEIIRIFSKWYNRIYIFVINSKN